MCMKLAAKVILYLALAVLATVSLRRVRTEFNTNTTAERRLAQQGAAENREPEPGVEVVSNGSFTLLTNVSGVITTNTALTAAPSGSTNELAFPMGNPTASVPISRAKGTPHQNSSALGGWLAGFIIALLGLAGLASWDFVQWLGTRANQTLGVGNEESKTSDPEYDAAEAEWAKGNHLDAINLMREYLSKKPNEQYVALRIAEIYEKDIGNYLAAALEYEEVLNRKLPREKWGWTALRLSNLYSGRLNQPDKAIATLERVNRDYSETAAAKKARERLGIPEATEEPVGEMDVNPILPVSPPTEEDSHLPAGFRRKK